MTKLRLRANGRPYYVRDYEDRHGHERIYFRKGDGPQTKLPGPMFSRAFWEAYHDCLAGQPEKVKPGASRVASGTFDALIVDYYQTATFIGLAPNTKRTYRSILEAFRRDYGDCLVADLDTRYADKIIGKVAERSKPQAAKLRKMLGMLLKMAKKWGYTKSNPMLEAERVTYKVKGYRAWTDDDIQKFRARWPEETSVRIAFELLLYTGLRRSDLVRLGPQHIEGNCFILRTKKSQGRQEAVIPIHPDFRLFLDRLPVKHLTYVATTYDAARSDGGFTNWIKAAAQKAGLPPDSSPHGVRKASLRLFAEAGATSKEMQSVTGHESIKELEIYTASADRRKLAERAIEKRGKVK